MMNSVAERFHNNGFTPLPIPRGQKGPRVPDWRNYIYNAGDFTADSNVGLLLGRAVVVDIDVKHPEASAHIQRLATTFLGQSPIRIGEAPKAAMLYRVAEPMRKSVTPKFKLVDEQTGEITEGQVEILANGQQCVAHGLHPNGYAYTYEGSPWCELELDDVKQITPIALEKFLEEATKVMQQYATPETANLRMTTDREVQKVVREFPQTPLTELQETVKDATQVYDANDYEQWIRFGMILHNETDGSDEGFALWDAFSQTADNYAGEWRMEKRWESFSNNPPANPVTLGSYIHEARANGVEIYRPNQQVAAVSEVVPEVTRQLLSEFDLSSAITERRKDMFRVSGGGKNQWYVWEGTHWAVDSNLRHFTAIRQDLAALTDNTMSQTRRLLNDVATLMERSEESLRIPQEDWDSNPAVLNTHSGLVDLRTGIVHPHSPEHLVTKVTGCDVTIGNTPLFDKFLSEIVTEADWGDNHALVKDFMVDVMALSLSGDQLVQNIFFWYGQGANGKSVMIDLLGKLLGDYAISLNSAALMSSGGKESYELARIAGTRVALTSEIEKTARWNEPLVKQLTGDSRMTVRPIYGTPHEIDLQTTLIIAGNSRPRFHGNDGGMARRVVLVPFKATIPEHKRDVGLVDKLFKEEGPAIMGELVSRVGAMYAGKGLEIPAAIHNASEKYVAENDDIGSFVGEWLEAKENAFTPTLEIYQRYKDWKQDRGEHAPASNVFIQDLCAKLNVETVRRTKKKVSGIDGYTLCNHEPL